MSRVMKDSGVEWIGKIPATWYPTRNKFLLTGSYSGGTPKATEDKFYCIDGVPFVSISDMSTSDYVDNTEKKLTDEGIADKRLKIIPHGTVIYSMYATVGHVAELNIDATISQAMIALFIDEKKINKCYYKYSLNAVKDYIYKSAEGTSQMNLNAEKVYGIPLTLPPMEEQIAVCDYLNLRCSYIDSAISKHQQIIEKLEEYRKAVITQAVTKGLNPNVEMKDSRDLIIGNIPMDWKCIPLKRLLSNCENNMRVGPFGSSLPSSVFQDEGPWVYNQRCVLDNNFATTDVHIPKWKFEEMKSFEVYPGDMLITTRGTI